MTEYSNTDQKDLVSDNKKKRTKEVVFSMRFKISTARGTACFVRRSLPSSFNGSRRQAPWIIIHPYYYSIRGTMICVDRFPLF